MIGARGRPRALVLRALGLGDLLTAVPALRALRHGLPGHWITLATPAWLAPLVQLADAVDDLTPTAGLEAVPAGGPPDLAVNLHGRGPQSLLALRGTGARRILSHRHPDFPGLAGPTWDDDLHEVTRWCRLVEWAGLPTDPSDLRLTAPGVEPAVAGAVVLHPGAAAPARRWPADRFAAVGRELARRGHRVVVTGSAAERSLGEEVAQAAGLPPAAVLSGALDLTSLAALVSAASLVLCGDTGVGHLASAYGIPSVLLFGPTPPARWGPPPGPHTVLWAGRRGDPHALVVDPGLLAIGVADVLSVLDQAATSGADVRWDRADTSVGCPR
ncbi:MAG: glycosyltransferase family 9 protein [Microlunatus sp.]|nr:glycosyltransferase family 9 protein [Microlunatus sp.]